MSQSRSASLIEAITNIVVGYGLSAIATILLFPLWGYHIRFTDALGISLAFTVLSLMRSYALRRAFNWVGARA